MYAECLNESLVKMDVILSSSLIKKVETQKKIIFPGFSVGI